MAKLSRLHNNANVLALGERIIGPDLAMDIVEAWITTDFSGDNRHSCRIQKITNIEKNFKVR